MRREHPDVYEIRDPGPPALEWPAQLVIDALRPMVTPERLARLSMVAAARTYDVVPVMEQLADPHNASAILRSADAFGIQRVHVVPHELGFHAAHGVALGTHRWLDIALYEQIGASVEALHAAGFVVLVADMAGHVRPERLAEIPRVALIMGNEHAGPSTMARELADDTFAIPMIGFVESLNVSVATAIALYAATRGRAVLPDEERLALTARFLMASVRDAQRIVREHVDARGNEIG